MGDKTGIEWTDATWNPVTGCDKVSPGCDHCYAESIAHRFAGTPAYPNGFGVTLRPERLEQPIRWKRPRRVFVNSMSDLFHPEIPDDYIARVFAVMALVPQHTFQVLSKRHGRMRSLLSSPDFLAAVKDWIPGIVAAHSPHRVWFDAWPLPNVWVGVSAEDQKRADLRIPKLLDTPAAVRFVSAEPLLGPIKLRDDWLPTICGLCNCEYGCNPPAGGLDWLIVGGESGPKARPMHPDWARSLRDQCTAAGVAFHFKQWGEWAPARWRGPDGATHAFTGGMYLDKGVAVENFMRLSHSPTSSERDDETPPGAQGMTRVGKKVAGRELDGRTWDEFPAVRHG